MDRFQFGQSISDAGNDYRSAVLAHGPDTREVPFYRSLETGFTVRSGVSRRDVSLAKLFDPKFRFEVRDGSQHVSHCGLDSLCGNAIGILVLKSQNNEPCPQVIQSLL
jgi:hypothetical protein